MTRGGFSQCARVLWRAASGACACRLHRAAPRSDMGLVPLFDGERFDSPSLLEYLGRADCCHRAASPFPRQASVVHSGIGAYQFNLGSVANGDFRYVQTFSSAQAAIASYRQDRDLTQYQSLSGYVRNDSGNPVTFSVELKDYTNSDSQKATRSFTIPANSTWTQFTAPLDLSSGWTINGTTPTSRGLTPSGLCRRDQRCAQWLALSRRLRSAGKGPEHRPRHGADQHDRRATGASAIHGHVDGSQ